MSDAFVCDRCGATISGQPPMQVGTKGTSVEGAPGGSIGAKVKKREDDPLSTVGISRQIPSDRRQAKWYINSGDLCDDCADAFREFWNDGEES